jgi:hypothetical protein
MLVSLGVGACVIGLCAAIGFRHQRFHRDVVAAVERTEQLEQIVALLPVSLRSVSPRDGDIPAGGARDTSLEFRATIGTGIVCDSVAGGAVMYPADSLHLASYLSRPEAGDTAWMLSIDSLSEHWIPRAINTVSDTTVACTLGNGGPLSLPGAAITLRWAGPPAARGSAVRVTRPWRYSLYKASDKSWYLGAKEWNSGTGRFNTIQPVAGPLLSPSAAGLRFSYYDSLGASIPSAAASTSSIALIEVTVNLDPLAPSRARGAFILRQRSAGAVALLDR